MKQSRHTKTRTVTLTRRQPKITLIMRAQPKTDKYSTIDNFKTDILSDGVACEPVMYDTLILSLSKLKSWLEVKELEIDELKVTTRQIAKVKSSKRGG